MNTSVIQSMAFRAADGVYGPVPEFREEGPGGRRLNAWTRQGDPFEPTNVVAKRH